MNGCIAHDGIFARLVVKPGGDGFDMAHLREMRLRESCKGLIVVLPDCGNDRCTGNADGLIREMALLAGALWRWPVPVVAALGARCTGAWLDLAFSCHFRVAPSSGRIGFDNSEHVLWNDGELGAWPLDPWLEVERRVLVESGRSIEVREAHRRGLVDRCSIDMSSTADAKTLLHALVQSHSRGVLTAVIASVVGSCRRNRTDGLRNEASLFMQLAAWTGECSANEDVQARKR